MASPILDPTQISPEIIPTGTVSGSSQIDIRSTTNFTQFSSSMDSRIDVINASGSGADWNVNVSNIPSGIISGSSQLTGSYDGRYQLSGSVGVAGTDWNVNLDNIPSGIISGSTQITNGSTLLSGSKTNITSLNNFTSSIQTEVNGISSVTSSYLTTLPSGLVSGSSQLTSSYDVRYTLSGSVMPLPDGLISGSSQIDPMINTYIVENVTFSEKTVLTILNSNISWIGTESNLYEVTLTGDCTLENPSNPVDGASYLFRIKQDGTGLHTLSFGSNWKFPNGTSPAITLNPNSRDYLSVIIDGIFVDSVSLQNML